ncbi:MAG: hypothetical protein F6K55_06785 [Moorea sp. SIO4A3]|nr:hypothetical protein [Moorena sp. SIO4A3]
MPSCSVAERRSRSVALWANRIIAQWYREATALVFFSGHYNPWIKGNARPIGHI